MKTECPTGPRAAVSGVVSAGNAIGAVTLFLFAQLCLADGSLSPDSGRLLLTGGATQFEGAGGGGLVPWALITGYGTRDSWGANVHYNYIKTSDFRINSFGAAVGAWDRVEVSFTQNDLTIIGNGALPLSGVRIAQNVYGLKVKVSGNVVYDQASWAPQVAAGMMYKKNTGIHDGILGGGIAANQAPVSADHISSTDFYVALTKLFLAQSLLVNVTLRDTQANEFGLLGFGGAKSISYKPEIEGSVAYLVTRKIAVGGEYRTKPRNLPLDSETNAWDLFAAWAPIKNVSVVAAYLNLGKILDGPAGYSSRQAGPYVSVQVGF